MSTSATSLRAVGVYRCRFTQAEIESINNEVFGGAPDQIETVRDQLRGLVVIELQVSQGVGAFDVGELAQVKPADRDDNSQVPYSESFWSDDGTESMEEDERSPTAPYRVVFFLHDFDPSQPLFTNDGGVIPLPSPSDLPPRLAHSVKYFWP